MEPVAAGLVRALCFFTAVEFPPSEVELVAAWDGGGLQEACPLERVFAVLRELIAEGVIRQKNGRCFFPGREAMLARHAEREVWFPRKWRRTKRVARLLSWLPGVRFVAVCNTMAWMDASDTADIDFFIVTKQGSLWQTRAACILPARFLGTRPSERHGERDALCFSFFVDETALNLTKLQLSDDPYFRHWFLSLLPCVDDGVGQHLWTSNEQIRQRHPFAPVWACGTKIAAKNWSWPAFFTRLLERLFRWGQERFFAKSIREVMNQDTRVVVNDHVLKFHNEDGRVMYREKYYALCKEYGIDP